MIENSAPYDLNIPVQCADTTTPLALVKRALALGYTTLALNTEVSQAQFLTKKQAKHSHQAKQSQQQGNQATLTDFPAPHSVNLTPADYPGLASRGGKPTILTRLTITIANNDFMIHYNKSAVAKQYDLLAVNVTTTAALQALLKSSFRWDILTFR